MVIVIDTTNSLTISDHVNKEAGNYFPGTMTPKVAICQV